ncbi:MAG: prepilin-type N-terminal cleavage/methylation domain-containing protein [Candidatus Gastranaerophilales bacterium]|nr:prepilin-type N-terminal cleavage/methylation domain-containing protein [Candidatus Gastranaerophilales bacterium]
MFNSENKKEIAKKGFTLAEVLITLLIIGVIASLTIPGLVQNTQEAEYNVAVKKIYSDLSNAVMMIQANNNGNVYVGKGVSSYADQTAFRDDFCNVMSCVQKGTSLNIYGSTTYKKYKGTDWYTVSDNVVDRASVLNNGTLLSFSNSPTCSNYNINACGSIQIDINGRKGPNMSGKDLFYFWVIRETPTSGNYSILPGGSPNDVLYQPSSCVVGGYGQGCAFKRLYDPDHMP